MLIAYTTFVMPRLLGLAIYTGKNLMTGTTINISFRGISQWVMNDLVTEVLINCKHHTTLNWVVIMASQSTDFH